MVELTYREALRDGMAEEMRRDPAVMLMGEEVGAYQGAYKCSQEMIQEFGPERVMDTPISEYGFAGLAVGASWAGVRPIVEFMTWNFSMQAIDHVINSAAKTYYMSGGLVKSPIVFRGPNGAAARVAAQHSQDYSSWYSAIPGLKVIAPATPADAKGLIKSAIRDNAPVCCLENEILYGSKGEVPEGDDVLVPIGKANVMKEGTDVTIIAYSINSIKSLEAAKLLQKEGINAEVIDLRTLNPLDEEAIIKSVEKTNRVVVVEETWAVGGVGATVMGIINDNAWDSLDAPVKRVSGEPVPMPYAKNLEELTLPQPDKIAAAVREVMNL